MTTPRRYVEALCFLSLAGVLLGAFFSPRASTHEVRPIWTDREVRPRPAEGRRIVPLSDPLGEVGPGQGLFRPTLIKIDAQDRLWALDGEDLKIKRFDRDGGSRIDFGRGRGVEPGHFANPTDFCWTPEGGLWVTDPVHRRLTRFDPRGQLVDTVDMPEAPYRLARRADGGLYSMALGSVDEIFVERGPDLELRRYFGKLLASEPAAVALDGWITTAGDRLIYAPAWLDVLVLYPDEGEPTFVRTLEPAAPLHVITDTAGNQNVDPRSWPVHRSLSGIGEEIGIYTVSGRGPGRKGLLDVYTVDGDYLETYPLPEPAASVALGPTTVASIHDGAVERRRRPDR